MIRLFRHLALLLFFFSFCCAVGGSTVEADEQLTVGVMKGAKPGSYRNEKGEMTGFSVDVGLALCKIINANCTLVEMGSLQELIDAVANNQVDFVPASLLETPERSTKMLFTTPYFRSSSYLVARKGVSLNTSGLRVVVLNGAKQMEYVRSTLGKDQQMMPVATVPDLVSALERGLADASVLAMFQATAVLSESKLIANGFVFMPLDVQELTGDAKIAVTRAKPQLRDRLNEALRVIRSNGMLEQINSRHIPFRVI
ncbi:MAG: transporter substrate-binding domain-containing protein [Betaproteobacteria bacterium]